MLIDTDILFWGRSKIIIIKHGSLNVTKVPKLCMEICQTVIKVLFFDNKGQVAQITVHKYKTGAAT